MGDDDVKSTRKRHHSESRDRDKHDRERKQSKKKKRQHSPDSDRAKKHKHKHKKHKKKSSKHKKEKKKESDEEVGPSIPVNTDDKKKEDIISTSTRNMKPMTKEEWEKQQSVVRRVYDPDTGRNRLVKGDGEIIEEIVSKERQREINKQATAGDGVSFQKAVGLLK